MNDERQAMQERIAKMQNTRGFRWEQRMLSGMTLRSETLFRAAVNEARREMDARS